MTKLFRFIRMYAPFIMVCYSFVFAMACIFVPFEYINFVYPYLSQSIGFSFFTTLVMASFYLNSKYCDSVKLSVLGLFLLNVVSLISIYLEKNTYYYDFFICLIIIVCYVSTRGRDRSEK